MSRCKFHEAMPGCIMNKRALSVGKIKFEGEN